MYLFSVVLSFFLLLDYGAQYACLFGMGHSAVGVVLGVGLCVAVWAGTSEVQ